MSYWEQNERNMADCHAHWLDPDYNPRRRKNTGWNFWIEDEEEEEDEFECRDCHKMIPESDCWHSNSGNGDVICTSCSNDYNCYANGTFDENEN